MVFSIWPIQRIAHLENFFLKTMKNWSYEGRSQKYYDNYRCLIRLSLTWNSIIVLLHSNAHAICHRWFNEALQKLTLLPKNLGICSSMDLMSFHADQSLSLFIYFLGKVFIIQFLSYINHTLLFLRNPIGKLTIEMIISLHSTNFFDRVETMYACKGQ